VGNFISIKNFIFRDDLNLVMTLEEFLYYLVNSFCLSTIIKGNVKLKIYPLLSLINDNVMSK